MLHVTLGLDLSIRSICAPHLSITSDLESSPRCPLVPLHIPTLQRALFLFAPPRFKPPSRHLILPSCHDRPGGEWEICGVSSYSPVYSFLFPSVSCQVLLGTPARTAQPKSRIVSAVRGWFSASVAWNSPPYRVLHCSHSPVCGRGWTPGSPAWVLDPMKKRLCLSPFVAPCPAVRVLDPGCPRVFRLALLRSLFFFLFSEIFIASSGFQIPGSKFGSFYSKFRSTLRLPASVPQR